MFTEIIVLGRQEALNSPLTSAMEADPAHRRVR